MTEDRYRQVGVDYETLDAAKRLAQQAALATSHLALARGAKIAEESRGEPAIVFDIAGVHLGFVLECLGTKSLIARDYEKACGVDHFAAVGYDTVAAVVNDCCCVGALPFVVNAYFATGAASFYEGTRHESLIAGFLRGCSDAGASWGGGESPTLSGLIELDAIELAGSAVGRVPDGHAPILGEGLSAGDEIVLVSSSGLHANGASLVRRCAEELPEGLMSALPSGRSLGEATLDESVIYVALVERALEGPFDVHYVSHITGHGLRKLMRARGEWTYRIHTLPEVPEVLSYLAAHQAMSPRESYGTFNMGCGFALYIGKGQGERLVGLAESLGYHALVAGVVEEGPRRVVLEPIDVVFSGEDLTLR